MHKSAKKQRLLLGRAKMQTTNLKNALVTSALLLVMVGTASGKTIYVNDDAIGANNGTSWQDAYTDLQSALLTSFSGDQIWVAAGTYKPGAYSGDSFRMKHGVEILGGFPDSSDPNMADRDWYGNPTILSGDIGVEGNNLDNCRHVFYHPSGTNLISSAVLDGFTITSGYSSDYGAGMYNVDCSPTISNCTFVGNIAVNGGALYNFSSFSSSPTLINCIFYDNSATAAGGGIYNRQTSRPVLTNCTFYNNTATTYGGGIYNDSPASSALTNCILWQDTAGTAGNEIYDSGIFSGSGVTYSDVDGGWNGTGNIDTDPCFVDAPSGDFHLRDTSPCIDAGANAAPSLPATDFEGDARIINGQVDMGADEFDVFYELTAGTEPAEGGTITLIPPGGDYFPGTVVTVTANAAVGYAFDHWSGDLTGSNNPETITMDSDYTVTAHFNYELSITLAPADGGTFTLDPPGGVYASGTMVELDVEPTQGYIFDYFSGDLSGSTEPNTIVMDSPKSVTVHFTLSDGSGTETDPYRIGTAGHLQFLSRNSNYWGPNIYFVLTDDITIPSGFIIDPIGNNSISFDANFDGAGHTISGLNQSGSDYLGLFGKTGPSAKLRNLRVVAATINGSNNFLGILVGYSYGTISHCSATGAVTGSSWLGGLVGSNKGTISDCSATGALIGGYTSKFLGGLVGENNGGTISDCYATGAVNGGDASMSLGGLVGKNDGNISNCYATGAVTGLRILGGLVGYSDSDSISNCYATGAVTGVDILGGLVGDNDFGGMISNCYATGAVTGGDSSTGLGGLVGFNYGTISNCYATGAVTTGTTSLDIGGLVGRDYVYGTISNCYWDINTSGMTDGVGSLDPEPAGVMGKATAEMKQQATFAGWDFTDTWLIMESQSYPYQDIFAGVTGPIPGDNNGDGAVDFKDLAILCGNWLAATEPEL